MAVIDVKITDLEPVDVVKNTDLLLISHPIRDSEGALVASTPYTSNCISGAALSSSVRETLRKEDVGIEGNWHFHGGPQNIPTQDTKLNTTTFISALEDSAKLSSIVNDMQSGWYRDELDTSTLQVSSAGTCDSTSVPNNSIPNIDFVERAIAGAYQSLLNQLTTIISPTGDSHFIPSHIGEIVYSTTLPPADSTNAWEAGRTIEQSTYDNVACHDALIKKRYGYGQEINGVKYPDTKWILHSGYFLRGGYTDTVVAGLNGKPNDDGTWKNATSGKAGGGADSTKITVEDYLPSHAHSLSNGNAKLGGSCTPNISISWPTYYVPGGTFAKRGGSDASSTGGGVHNAETVGSNVNCGRSGGSYGGKSTSVSISYGSGSKTDYTGQSGNDHKPFPTLPVYKNVYIWERVQ